MVIQDSCVYLYDHNEEMNKGRLLVIVDDARVSRFICHVAKRLELSCLAISKNDDLAAAHEEANPDVIFLSINSEGFQQQKVMQQLAGLKTDAAILLAGVDSDQIRSLEDLGRSLGLNMDGALPDIFDTDMLKQQLATVFQGLGKQTPGRSGKLSDADHTSPAGKITKTDHGD